MVILAGEEGDCDTPTRFRTTAAGSNIPEGGGGGRDGVHSAGGLTGYGFLRNMFNY
jgi:hypothetical protein